MGGTDLPLVNFGFGVMLSESGTLTNDGEVRLHLEKKLRSVWMCSLEQNSLIKALKIKAHANV